MENREKKTIGREIAIRLLSWLLIATLALATAGCAVPQAQTEPTTGKLEELAQIIEEYFIGEADRVAMEDAAAAAMVDSLGDRWSYYISAEDYDAYLEQSQNAYVGIGVTVTTDPETGYFVIQKVEPGSGAEEAGILPGDMITGVEGTAATEMTMTEAANIIKGEENTYVNLTLQRGSEEISVQVLRKTIKMIVATGQMLEGNIGLVTIYNFDARCAEETIAAIEALLEQGAQSLIFDVRNNPGGYKNELVKVLNYLLPEGDLFHTLDYEGNENTDTSDARCLRLPMAVLVNGDSYSAAEFFAAALEEYDWAVVVGEQTCGKGYFQTTIRLQDGSAVGLSIGKYFTPNGVSLAEVGGLTPDVVVTVDDETAAKIYYGQLTPEEDPQIQAAIEALQ